jgi:hypothetical protein
MYSSIPGAKQGPDGWVMDCKNEVTGVSFTFGGVEIPIHPLDITAPLSFITGDPERRGCLGLWQEIGGAGSGNLPEGLDMVLGMAFRTCKSCRSLIFCADCWLVRNAYMLVNVGDFVEGTTNKTADPFIQMLPLTNDTTRVHNEFVSARTNLKNGSINGAANIAVRGSTVLVGVLVVLGATLCM